MIMGARALNNSQFLKVVSEEQGVVFLIDDSVIFLRFLEMEIKKSLPNCDIYCFPNGEACMEYLHLKPMLIFLDFEIISKEGDILMNGINVLKKIKQFDSNIDIVMLSSNNDLRIATRSVQLGAFDYLVKSENSINLLRNRIVNILRNKRLRERSERSHLLKKQMLFGLITVGVVFLIILGLMIL